MADTYEVHKSIIHNIFKDLIDNDNVNYAHNADHIKDILLRELSSHHIECIVHLMMIEEEYKPVKVGDYVIVKPKSFHLNTEYEPDYLEEMGLLPSDGCVYGQVIDDESWSTSSVFNPFYSRIKVNLLYHDDKHQVQYVEDTFNPIHLQKVDKRSIKYFKKDKKNGT
tara:strand:+ start:25 stop:525 length:501 start_codon:yes stop_codon:yes gene_type:complete